MKATTNLQHEIEKSEKIYLFFSNQFFHFDQLNSFSPCHLESWTIERLTVKSQFNDIQSTVIQSSEIYHEM